MLKLQIQHCTTYATLDTNTAKKNIPTAQELDLLTLLHFPFSLPSLSTAVAFAQMAQLKFVLTIVKPLVYVPVCCYAGQKASNDALRPHMPRSVALRSMRNADIPDEWERDMKKTFKGNETLKPYHLVERSANCTTSAVDNGNHSFINTRNFSFAE